MIILFIMDKLEKIIGEYSFFLDQLIGKGTGGDVYKGNHIQTKQIVAIK